MGSVTIVGGGAGESRSSLLLSSFCRCYSKNRINPDLSQITDQCSLAHASRPADPLRPVDVGTDDGERHGRKSVHIVSAAQCDNDRREEGRLRPDNVADRRVMEVAGMPVALHHRGHGHACLP